MFENCRYPGIVASQGGAAGPRTRGIQFDVMPSHDFYTTPTLRLVVGPTASVDADVLVVPVFADTDPTSLDLPDDVTQGMVALRDTQELKGEPYEQHWLRPGGVAAGRVLLLGSGPATSASADVARRLGLLQAWPLVRGGRAAWRSWRTVRCRTKPQSAPSPRA